MHSESGRQGGTVTITLIYVTDGIRVEVIDDGSQNEPAVRPSELKSVELAESGRGLQLVEFLSANWITTAILQARLPGSSWRNNQMNEAVVAGQPADSA
jgi:hypothetical protein